MLRAEKVSPFRYYLKFGVEGHKYFENVELFFLLSKVKFQDTPTPYKSV
jgi:hypothetical protein